MLSLLSAAVLTWSGPEVHVAQINGTSWLIIDGEQVSPQYIKVTLTHTYAADNWTEVDYELDLACSTAGVKVVAFESDYRNESKYGRTEPGTDWVYDKSHPFNNSTLGMFTRLQKHCPGAYIWPVIDAWVPPETCSPKLEHVVLHRCISLHQPTAMSLLPNRPATHTSTPKR